MARTPPPKTRNGGQWTEARYFQFIRSGLRSLSMKWGPVHAAEIKARRPSQSSNKKLKWEYRCAACGEWFPRKEVQVDHIVPAGSIKCHEDIGPFVERLLVEVDGFQVLCKDKCHHGKTKSQRAELSG